MTRVAELTGQFDPVYLHLHFVPLQIRQDGMVVHMEENTSDALSDNDEESKVIVDHALIPLGADWH